jgi:hypothetical protein
MIFQAAIPLGGLGSHKVGSVAEKKCGLKVKHRHTTCNAYDMIERHSIKFGPAVSQKELEKALP